MKLDELAGGAVYVDTNVWYMYLRTDPVYQQTLTTFLGRVVRGAIEAFVGILVLDELFYRLLLARVKDATGRTLLKSCVPTCQAPLQPMVTQSTQRCASS
jgi:predicted nucleic acid-binding protein